ncbi:MAG: dihydroneopterin aldolase [Acidimicrobiales bacterium]
MTDTSQTSKGAASQTSKGADLSGQRQAVRATARGPGRIEVTGLRVLGHHGASDAERQRAQPFEIDIVVDADISHSAASDQLCDTADYSRLVSAAADVVSGLSFALMEALAWRVAERVLDEASGSSAGAGAVTVRVRKLRPPVPFDVSTAGVTVTLVPAVAPRPAPTAGAGTVP